MITANEARLIANTSQIKISEMLEEIGKVIEEKSALNIRSIYLDHELPDRGEYKLDNDMFRAPNLTPIQAIIVDALKCYPLEYCVAIIVEEHDGRAGLGSIDDDPKPFSTYHIKVSW